MNCLIIDDDELSRTAIKHLVSQVRFLNLVGICTNAVEAMDLLNKEKTDLMFLDIEMPELNGLDFIKSLKAPPLTIFATSKSEYAVNAFECNVVDYLVKPIAIDRFFKAVSKAKEIYDTSKHPLDFANDDYMFIKNNSTLHRVNIKEILWIEALGDYITINTSQKRHTVHSTLKAIEHKLSSDKFIRVHRSFIVSIDAVNTIDDTCIVMENKLIPIGAVYKENLTKRLNLL